MISACRQDMHDQPRYEPLEPSTFFADGRSARAPVEGTVAQGQLRDDEHLHTGKIEGKPAAAFPFPIARADLERGQERFDIFCSPCHGRTGDGLGMIVRRGFRRPPSLHDQRLLEAPPGHLFDVMTSGFGAMPRHAHQVSTRDRWRIAAYVRALQLSRNATLAEVPEAERARLEAAR